MPLTSWSKPKVSRRLPVTESMPTAPSAKPSIIETMVLNGEALPMPMIAHRLGATIICPPDAATSALFASMGKVIEVENSAEFNALSVVTATYASYFKYLDTINNWLKKNGVEEGKGRDYIASLFKALGSAPEMSPGADFMHLAQDYATRGGINEQVLRELTERGMFDAFAESLGRVHRRIAGE